MEACLDENTVLELIEGSLDAARAGAVGAHIDVCVACRRLVALAAGDGEPPAEGPLAPGATLGRHVILEAVGAGAMGFVYAAYDPELHRKVALKLLRPDRSAASLRGRLLREARAMARLAHPNVLTLHDVGSCDDRVYIAMEFVDGGTLSDWMARGLRPWRVVLDAFRQAGEGLAAAHAAGIVHRDFKPDNVLVGGDGRVRVTDFGLARAAETEAREGGAGAADAGAPTLTQHGALVGTPAYMAPEQLAGSPGTARSDQYAFCVALHEALHGARPGGAAPRGRRTPAWIDRVTARGLRAEPEARFPSMRALLDALAAGPPLGPRRVLGAAGALLAIAVLGVVVVRRPAAPVCSGAAAAWGDVYGDAERGAVRAALVGAGRTGETVFGLVDRELVAYRDAWTAMHTGACEATRVRGEQSGAMLDLRMACLADRRRAVEALTGVLARADAEVLAGAAEAASRLPAIGGCADTRALAMRVPPAEGAAQRAAVARAEAPIAEASALADLGLSTRGLEAIARAAAPAQEAAYPPLEARRLFVEGRLHYGAGALASAEAKLHEAAIAAEVARDDGLLAEIWTLLGRLVGVRHFHVAEGRRWLAYAEAALRRTGGDDQRELQRLDALAMIAWYGEGRHEEARALLAQERALVEKRCAAAGPGGRPDEPGCLGLVPIDNALAALLSDTGHADEAIPIYERVRAAFERTDGPDAPSVTLAMVNEGEALALEGRPAEALELILRARATRERAGRWLHDGFTHHRAADALRRLGRFDEALAEDRAALVAQRGTYGEEDRHLASPLAGLGEDLLALGRAREAVAPLERAVSLLEAPPTVAADLAACRFALARALWDGGGDRARARSLASSAREALVATGYGGWLRRQLDAIDRWLAAHPEKD